MPTFPFAVGKERQLRVLCGTGTVAASGGLSSCAGAILTVVIGFVTSTQTQKAQNQNHASPAHLLRHTPTHTLVYQPRDKFNCIKLWDWSLQTVVYENRAY